MHCVKGCNNTWYNNKLKKQGGEQVGAARGHIEPPNELDFGLTRMSIWYHRVNPDTWWVCIKIGWSKCPNLNASAISREKSHKTVHQCILRQLTVYQAGTKDNQLFYCRCNKPNRAEISAERFHLIKLCSFCGRTDKVIIVSSQKAAFRFFLPPVDGRDNGSLRTRGRRSSRIQDGEGPGCHEARRKIRCGNIYHTSVYIKHAR